MPLPARLFLLASAAICGAFVASLGGSFARAVEPESYTAGTSLFWFLTAAVFVAPLWAPAAIPNRYPVVQKIGRRVGAAALLIPLFIFGGIVVHNLQRSIAGLGASPVALAQGAVLTLLCVTCFLILLWPELRRRGERAA